MRKEVSRNAAGPVTILLADDQVMVREGVKKLLEEEPGFRVVGEASNGQEAVSLAQKLNPRVVILGIAMPLMNGIEAAKRIGSQDRESGSGIRNQESGIRNQESGYSSLPSSMTKSTSGGDFRQAPRDMC